MSYRRKDTTLTFAERYAELYHDMKLPMWQVCKKMSLTPASLARMLSREKMPVPAELTVLLPSKSKENA